MRSSETEPIAEKSARVPRCNLAGILLCGGQSLRMGTPKHALPFGSETMLARMVRLLQAALDGPIIVVAARHQILESLTGSVVVTCDRQSGRGPLEGIATGLAQLPKTMEAAYVTSCDAPLLQAPFVRHLATYRHDHEAVVPVDRLPHPLAAIYCRSILPSIDRLLDAGQRRVRDLLTVVDTRLVPVAELRVADPELYSLWNLNTPEQYEAARRVASTE